MRLAACILLTRATAASARWTPTGSSPLWRRNAAGFSGDGGAAVNAALCSPSGRGRGRSGDVYIADTGNERIRKVATNGVITTFAGTNVGGYSGDGGAAPANARLNGPIGVALDAVGNLYIADTGNERMRMVNTNGIITTLAGNGTPSYSGDGGAAMNAGLNRPAGVILDSAGNLYIADNYNNRIRRVDFSGYPTLALSNVVAGNEGSYTVVISNAYGSVTSAVVTFYDRLPTLDPCSAGQRTRFGGQQPRLFSDGRERGRFGIRGTWLARIWLKAVPVTKFELLMRRPSSGPRPVSGNGYDWRVCHSL